LIPAFNRNGVLPPGVHWSTMDEIRDKLCFSKKRENLFNGLIRAIASLKEAGCKTIYIDGSFSTTKHSPGDIDVCWEVSKVDLVRLNLIEPVFFNFENGRKEQKAKFGCEFFPARNIAKHPNTLYLDFFQTDKDNKPKGIIGLKI
jgi:hypothetical protein